MDDVYDVRAQVPFSLSLLALLLSLSLFRSPAFSYAICPPPSPSPSPLAATFYTAQSLPRAEQRVRDHHARMWDVKYRLLGEGCRVLSVG
jgi:hypothetical protein